MERPTLKIALCIPVYGQCSSRFLYALLKMVTFTTQAHIEMDGKRIKPELIPLIVSCSMLGESRNRLVVEAIHHDAEYLLWLDADHVFPEDTLVRLLSRSKPVIGCNYARRFEPTSPTAAKLTGEGEEKSLLWTTAEKAEANEIEEVAHLGFGVCLMHMSAFEALQAQAAKEGKEHFWPLFHFETMEDGIRSYGEDVYFFKKLRDAGVPVFVDHGVSWHVGHCHETILTNAHTVAMKDKWAAWNSAKLDKYKQVEPVNGA